MKHEAKYNILVIILAMSFLYAGNVIHGVKASKPSRAFMASDVRMRHDMPSKHNSTITPGYNKTSEYLIGSVAVGIIF